MGTWSRGRRCGIDNCKSRLWRVVDGQKVCRNGHVKAGEYEIGEDEDDFAASQGRRLTIPSQQTAASQPSNPENEILYGKDGNALFMQCFQLILRKQVEWLIKVQGLKPELAKVVKNLWALYISDTKFAKTQYGEGEESEDASDLATATTTTTTTTARAADEEESSEGEGEEVGGGEQKQVHVEKIVIEHVELVHSIILCYLGCVLLRIPVYIYDFNRWVYRYEIPYMKSLMLVPYEMRKKLPMYYHSQLTPRGAPIADRLHEELQKLVFLFHDSHKLDFPAPSWDPLLFKVVHDLLLPPEVWVAARKLLAQGQVNQWWKPDLQRTRRIEKRRMPELVCVCTVVVCVKLCFGLEDDSDYRGDIINPDSVANLGLNWSVWADMLRKLWVEDESLSEADERDVLFWDEAKLDRYLTWFEENFIQQGADHQRAISQKRLYDMFPVGIYNDQGELIRRTGTNGRRRESFSVAPKPGTVGEILTFVHASTQQKTEEDISPAEEYQPGARYASYRTNDSMPVLIDTLYQATARLAAVRVDTIRSIVHHIELLCKKKMKKP